MPPTNDDVAAELDLINTAWSIISELRPIDRARGAAILELAQRFSAIDHDACSRMIAWVQHRATADYLEAAARAAERRTVIASEKVPTATSLAIDDVRPSEHIAIDSNIAADQSDEVS